MARIEGNPPAKARTSSPSIGPSVLGAVVGVLRELGFTDTGGDPDDVFERAARTLGEPMLGIVVAQRVPVGAYGLLEYGMRASATIGDALQRLARHYGSVTNRVRTELGTIEGRSALIFHRRPGVRHSRHWIEMPAAAIAGRIAEGAGREPMLYEVRFAHPEPPGNLRSRYVEAFGAPVLFRAPKDALVFLDGSLRRAMWTGESAIASSVDAALEAAEIEEPDPLRARLRAAILAGLSRGVTLASVARELRISPRTLQRSIASRGSSWSNELDEVRRERALVLLESDHRKTSQIAAELGFYDASSFFRAFRRWTGTTPSHHRGAKTGDPDD